MLKDQVATIEMIDFVSSMISVGCTSRDYVHFTLRASYKATHAQADDAIGAARHKTTEPTLWLRR